MVAGLLAGLVFLVPALLVGSMLYFQGINSLNHSVRQNLMRLAKAAAVLVDPTVHQTFHDPSQESSEAYNKAIAPLRRFQDSDSDIKFVYTITFVNGKAHFILDPTEAGDSDGDGQDDKSHIMEEYDEATPAMVQAYRTGLATSDQEPTTDAWGTFISGYAPIRDDTGKVIAITGVDLEAGRYEHRLASMNRAGEWAAVFIILVTAIIGICAWSMQARVLKVRKEQEEVKNELEDLAQSLDRANARLRSASRRFEQLFNLLPVACFTLDSGGVIFEWNQECERLTGYPAPIVIQSRFVDYIEDSANVEMFNQALASAMKGEPTMDREWTDVSRDGRSYTAILTAFPLYASSGEVTGMIAACADITVRKELERQIESQMVEITETNARLAESRSELERANTELVSVNTRLEQLAAIDGLTGLWNRRRAYEILTFEIANVKSTGLPVSILMLDIDHFKKLNDTHGHLVGDAVLRMVAASIKGNVRDQDSVCRYGGEEFIVILPGSDEAASKRIAERVRSDIASHQHQGCDVTVSIGAGTCYDPEQGNEPFIGRADKALYAAKKAGRNRVLHVDDLKRSNAA